LRKLSSRIAVLAVLASVAVAVCYAQQAARQAPPPAQPPVAPGPAATALAEAHEGQPATKSPANPPTVPQVQQTPQHKALADDTAKLLILANELKAELDKSTKDTLSLGVIKKAEEVEKLAHKVRDEMRVVMAQ